MNQESDYCQLIEALQEKTETLRLEIKKEELTIEELRSRKATT